VSGLTWENLKRFHASHYHPSNARFYTYGNIPLEHHLARLDDYLQRFEYAALNTAIPPEPRFISRHHYSSVNFFDEFFSLIGPVIRLIH
jgi:Zn-dependent M16 (insulinase) family peptidase